MEESAGAAEVVVEEDNVAATVVREAAVVAAANGREVRPHPAAKAPPEISPHETAEGAAERRGRGDTPRPRTNKTRAGSAVDAERLSCTMVR